MSIGKGGTYTLSWKQKLNPKSSNEAELVAIYDAMAQILWTRHFLVAQGISVPTKTIYQDNKSTILLSVNGQMSSSKWTKHLNISYYFVMDWIKQGEVKVMPNQEHVGRFFHQTTSRNCILQDVWADTQSALH